MKRIKEEWFNLTRKEQFELVQAVVIFLAFIGVVILSIIVI